jgi:outer membrane protein TolC
MHPVLAQATIAELEAAIVVRRKSHLENLKRRRAELARELTEIESTIAEVLGRPATEELPTRESPAMKAAKRGLPTGLMLLKALAARHPRQASAPELVSEMRARLPESGAENLVKRTLGRMKASGLLFSSDDEYFSLTPRGIDRAGGV